MQEDIYNSELNLLIETIIAGNPVAVEKYLMKKGYPTTSEQEMQLAVNDLIEREGTVIMNDLIKLHPHYFLIEENLLANAPKTETKTVEVLPSMAIAPVQEQPTLLQQKISDFGLNNDLNGGISLAQICMIVFIVYVLSKMFNNSSK